MARKSNAKAKEKKQKIIAGRRRRAPARPARLPAAEGAERTARRGAAPAATTTTATTTTPGATTTPPAATGTSSFAASTEKLCLVHPLQREGPVRAARLRQGRGVVDVHVDAACGAAAAGNELAGFRKRPALRHGRRPGDLDAFAQGRRRHDDGARVEPAGRDAQAERQDDSRALGQAFPVTKPMFRLAGIKPGSVRIALVKGGLADGTTAITVQKHHPLTLVNTATTSAGRSSSCRPAEEPDRWRRTPTAPSTRKAPS